MEIEAFLEDLGVPTCFLAGTVENALLVLGAKEIAFAVVDVDLGHETSEGVAVALQARGIPFIFVTGYGNPTPMMARFPAVPSLMKPFDANALHALLARLGIL